MDHITIQDLRIQTKIGVTEAERAQPRTVTVSIDIWADLDRAGQSDDLDDTIDYHRVTLDVAELVRATEARLLEHLAHKIAASIGAIEGVKGVSVEVVKESPPVDENVKAVAVRIERAAR